MPSNAQILAARREALSLPERTIGRTGTLVPVTGEMCSWIEILGVGLGVGWALTRTPPMTVRPPEHEVYLRLGPTAGARLYVAFDKHGQWRHVTGSRRWPGYLSERWRSRSARAHLEAQNLVPTVRHAWFPALSKAPSPPAWVSEVLAQEQAEQEQARLAAIEAYESALRETARAQALAVLADRHPGEFADILEEQYLVAALEHGRPQTSPMVGGPERR